LPSANKATQLGAAAGAGGGLLIQKYGFMQNSQEDEMEESSKGKAPEVLRSLQDAMSTPPSQKRVDQMLAADRSVDLSAQQNQPRPPLIFCHATNKIIGAARAPSSNKPTSKSKHL
jgi:hypothetical protein